MYQGRTLATIPLLEELVGARLERLAEAAVGVTLAEAGVVCAAFPLADWSKQAEEVDCAQQESMRD
jgi:hypothetical protein